MKMHIFYLSIILGMLSTIPVLRQINNRLGYELMSHDEIESARINIQKYRMTAWKYARLLREHGISVRD